MDELVARSGNTPREAYSLPEHQTIDMIKLNRPLQQVFIDTVMFVGQCSLIS